MSNDSPHHHLYNTRRWRTLRRNWLTMHPLCKYCEDLGRIVSAEEVDHVEPHRGNTTLFWSEDNLQSLCSTCHRSVKASMERGGQRAACDAQGRPLDPQHHWNT